MTREEHEEAVKAIEKELNWTQEEASDCGCNFREYPCDNCWSLGWRMGGLEPVEPPQ